MLYDIVGETGTPIENQGFEITIDKQSEFAIGKGRYYVEGIICENNTDKLNARNQEDLPDHSNLFKENQIVPQENGFYIVYLDVWQRHITALEDPTLLETALGGADTTTRTKNIWQAKTLKVDATDAQEALTEFEKWKKNAYSTGKLRAKTKTINTNDNEPTTEAGYSGDQNRLYRIEIHSNGTLGTTDTPTAKKPIFKWSRENATIAAKILKITSKQDETEPNKKTYNIVIETEKKDTTHNFKNQWIEVTNDYCELWNIPGQFLKINGHEKDHQENQSTLETTITTTEKTLLDYITENEDNKINIPKIRRWNTPKNKRTTLNQTSNTTCPDNNAEYSTDKNEYIDLEEGIQIKFEAGNYVAGDYWLIPTRTITKSIEWPTTTKTNQAEPDALASMMKHHYCPLALLRCTKKTENPLEVIYDYREFFSATSKVLNFYYISGDGQEITPENVMTETVSFKNSGNNTAHTYKEKNELETGAIVTPILLCVGARKGNMPIETINQDNYFVRFEVQDEYGMGRLFNTSERMLSKTHVDAPLVGGIAKCNWIFITNWIDSTNKHIPGKQQVSATLMLKADREARPCHTAPIFFNAIFAQANKEGGVARPPVATVISGIVRLEFSHNREWDGPLISNPITHLIEGRGPPAIILSLLPSETIDKAPDETVVESFEDFYLYNWENILSKNKHIQLPRFKTIDVNPRSFRILIEQSFPRPEHVWYLRWWAIPAQQTKIQTATFEPASLKRYTSTRSSETEPLEQE
jgi:hypothetical protein